MLDIKVSVIVMVNILLGLSGILFWFSDGFSHFIGVAGFFKRLFAGITCIIILFVLTAIASRH